MEWENSWNLEKNRLSMNEVGKMAYVRHHHRARA
jgi:hypothetical protein